MTTFQGFLQGKRALLVGIANQSSICYGIGESLHQQGASLAVTYQSERLKSRVEKIASNWQAEALIELDVGSDTQIEQAFKHLEHTWPEGFDILIHSVAYAPKALLEGDYLEQVDREGFQIAHDISSYSLAALGKAAQSPMKKRGSGAILTLSYLGANQVIPNYNVMGLAKASLEANVRYMANSLGNDKIRVNAVSAGPIRTLAASGIKGIRKMLAHHAAVSPLRENVSSQQVGDVAAFLCSDMASGITGEVIHVDSGYHIMGMSSTSETA